MSSRHHRQVSYHGKDIIPIESPNSSDLDMETGQTFDGPRRRRRRIAHDDSYQAERESLGDDRRYSNQSVEPQETRRRASAAAHSSSNDQIPGLSSDGGRPRTAAPSYDTRPPHEDHLSSPRSRSRRRSTSPRSRFSASQAPILYNRPPSPMAEAAARGTRSHSRGRSSCNNVLALPRERERHGSSFSFLRIRNPTGEMTTRRRAPRDGSLHDEKQPRRPRKSKKS